MTVQADGGLLQNSVLVRTFNGIEWRISASFHERHSSCEMWGCKEVPSLPTALCDLYCTAIWKHSQGMCQLCKARLTGTVIIQNSKLSTKPDALLWRFSAMKARVVVLWATTLSS